MSENRITTVLVRNISEKKPSTKVHLLKLIRAIVSHFISVSKPLEKLRILGVILKPKSQDNFSPPFFLSSKNFEKKFDIPV